MGPMKHNRIAAGLQHAFCRIGVVLKHLVDIVKTEQIGIDLYLRLPGFIPLVKRHTLSGQRNQLNSSPDVISMYGIKQKE